MEASSGQAARMAVSQLQETERNDPCPCGSGKKFKRCHMGMEGELLRALEKRFNPDPAEAARRIMDLPPCDHPRAREMADQLELVSAAGRKIKLKLVDLAAYLALDFVSASASADEVGGIFINPVRTRTLMPDHLYLALSPRADQSTVMHQLAHIADFVSGSHMHPGLGSERAQNAGVPAELMEHPQEFGDTLMEMSQRLGVELDAEDEIVAFLARKKMLLPARLIVEGKPEELTGQAEVSVRFLQSSREEIDAIIKNRKGYKGQGGS